MRRWLLFSTVVLLMAIALPTAANDQIIDIQGGSASLQREGMRRRRPAVVGDVLQVGDRIYPFYGARVQVLCQNGNSQTRSRQFGLDDVCPGSRSHDPQEGRGEDDFLLFLENQFAYASQVSEENPVLRWNPVVDTTNYQVQLWECGRAVFNCTSMIWSTTVEGTEVRYSGSALQPGHNYQLVAIAQSTQEQSAYLKLRRLDEDKSAALQSDLTALNSSSLTPEAQAIALARVYLSVAEPDTLPPEGAGLVLEAIAPLEAVSSTSSTPYIHRLLGDLYLQVGLLNAAQSAYERVLTLTDSSLDLSNRAAAQVGLANIAAVQDDRLTAEQRLQQARISYMLLAESDRLAQIEEWLDTLLRNEN